jgi:signal transduction histidine kinase
LARLTTRRTALVLYGVLLVLPTLVLVGLHQRALGREHAELTANAPRAVEDAARRLSAEIESRLAALLEREDERPFYVYRRAYFPVGTIGTELALVPSPLATGPAPEGVLAWFARSVLATPGGELALFGGERARDPEWPALEAELRASVEEMLARDQAEGYLRTLTRFGRWQAEELPATIAAINLHPGDDLQCLRGELAALAELVGETMRIDVSGFHLRFWLEPDGRPRIAALRRVRIEGNHRLREVPTCIESMGWGATLVQGFFVDPRWYFGALPQSCARAVLDPELSFRPPFAPAPEAAPSEHLVAVRPVELMRCEVRAEEELGYGTMLVGLDTAEVEARGARQTRRFLGVAAMLVLSLGTGLVLLLRSVQRDLDEARRTENFVAAVTHELRTPLAAIRLYGEMLLDGWVRDEEKRDSYYRRIVRETGRLETLVERVLEQGRITAESAPQPGDLSLAVDAARASLVQTQIGSVSDDVAFELAEDLPPVLLHPDGLRSVLVNLVENARKYAPVDRSRRDAEPILVRTRMHDGRVVLEVLDRGPGIPPSERTRVFEAFYRIGNEATRTASGTGLGLHLVAVQMRAMRGGVQVLDREGGGTIFRLSFHRADEPA